MQLFINGFAAGVRFFGLRYSAVVSPRARGSHLKSSCLKQKENGLNEPVVVAQIQGEWMLIDGRNRREACRIAEVIPTYRIVEADADKLKSLVWSWNGPRRHLTSSQKAMAYAMMFPDGEKGGRGKKLLQNCNSLEMNSTDKSNISRARFILKHDSESAKLVRDGHPNCGGWRTPRDYFPVVFLKGPKGRCLPRFRTAKFKIILIIMNESSHVAMPH